MDSPHTKILRRYSITHPLVLQLLDHVDQNTPNSQGDDDDVNITSGGSQSWASRYQSLSEMAGWLNASPWYKWREKRRFPVKFILHITIAMLCIAQVAVISTRPERFVRNSRNIFSERLETYCSTVYDIGNLARAMNEAICGMCNFATNAVFVFSLKNAPILTMQTLVDGGKIYNVSEPNFSMDTETTQYSIGCQRCPNALNGTLLDKAHPDWHKLHYSLRTTRVHFDIEEITWLEGRYCLNWDIDVLYEVSRKQLLRFSRASFACTSMLTVSSHPTAHTAEGRDCKGTDIVQDRHLWPLGKKSRDHPDCVAECLAGFPFDLVVRLELAPVQATDGSVSKCS